MSCTPEVVRDIQSAEDLTVTVAAPAGVDLPTMVWQYALVAEDTASRTWAAAITTASGCTIRLTGSLPAGRYSIYVRGPSGAPTLRVPGTLVLTG